MEVAASPSAQSAPSPTAPCWAAKVLPTSGSRSISVWDVDSIESFQHWLDETMEADCESEVFEVDSQSQNPGASEFN